MDYKSIAACWRCATDYNINPSELVGGVRWITNLSELVGGARRITNLSELVGGVRLITNPSERHKNAHTLFY